MFMYYYLILLILFTIFKQYEFKCSSTDHYCGENNIPKCISIDWVCDGNQDCDNGSDELNCPKFTCDRMKFACPNSNQCFERYYHCDGTPHCLDGSDEVNCTKSCDRRMQYDCRTGGNISCVPLGSVCNKDINCLNKPNCSIEMCKTPDGKKCSHKCINKYSTFACDCPSGMILDDDQKTCKYNNCSETPNICPQGCFSNKTTFHCFCYSGYILKGNECIPEYPQEVAYMFYSSHNTIYSIPFLDKSDPDIKHQRSVLETTYIIRTFDVKENDRNLVIYSTFFERNMLAINKVQSQFLVLNNTFKNRNGKTFYFTLTESTFYGTALDPARNLLFYGDLESRSISVINVTSMDKLKLIERDCYYPISVALNPITSKIYWIDNGYSKNSPRIEMANMDGTNRSIILENGLFVPHSLLMDVVDNRIYWINRNPPSINFLQLNPSNNNVGNVTVVLPKMFFEPSSIAIFGDKVYWSDLRHNRIYSAHKTSGKGIKVIQECDQPKNLRIFTKQSYNRLIKEINNDQSAKMCSGLINKCPNSCLPNSNNPRCFGPPSGKGHYSAWYYVLIPILISVTVCTIFVIYRCLPTSPVINVSYDSRCLHDNVRFWEDQSSVSNDFKVDVSDRLPFINNSE